MTPLPLEMAGAILDLLANRDLSLRLGDNAVREAQRRFDLAEQAQQYIAWYYEILAQHRKASGISGI
jgi:glycosyltransferase involved in cell wall biosynthesis